MLADIATVLNTSRG
ncbi:MAG: hypothetical protein EZS28_038106, partial [Streblomastix strix]